MNWRAVTATAAALLVANGVVQAQELEPGAYSPSPVGFNILVVGDTFNTGDIAFDPSAPIDKASADIHAGVVGYLRTVSVAGRAASLGFAVPYVRGDLEGLVQGQPRSAHRSGWGDPRVRFALNLRGVPAMTAKEFVGYQHAWSLGASLTVGVPLGQYDPTKLINIGGNRWAFKPELGYVRSMGAWTFEAAAGAWFFTDNDEFFNGGRREQDPIGSGQVHLTYTFRPRLWLSLDGNYYSGGRTTLNGVRNLDLQKNSRTGLTLAVPLNLRHSLKLAYSRGATTTIGADFEAVGVSYQYLWGSSR